MRRGAPSSYSQFIMTTERDEMSNQLKHARKKRLRRVLLLGIILTHSLIGLHRVLTDALAAPLKESGEAEFVSWVKANAIPLDTLDWTKINSKNFSFLDRALQGKRVVYLGEPDHYIHEKYDYCLILIKYLVDHGWRHIGSEIGRSDGRRINRFLETADVRWLDRVSIYGYRGALRTDRDHFSGGLARIALAKANEWKSTVIPEERWFAQQLRTLMETRPAESPRIHFFGFDVDVLPGGAYEDLEALLAPYSGSTIAQVRKHLRRVHGETIDDEIARLSRVIKYIECKKSSLKRLMGPSNYNEAHNTVLCLHDSFKFAKSTGNDVPPSVRREAMTVREQTMFRQMEEVISKLKSEEKIILLGHNTHLS